MICSLLLLAPTAAAVGLPPQEGADLFRTEVAPILEAHCLSCHDEGAAKGGVTFAGDVLPEGIVEPGHPERSLLLELVRGPEPEMPLKAPPLSAGEVATLRRWIEAGAPWTPGVVGAAGGDPWWSLQPVEAPPLPALPERWQGWAREPVDAFVLRSLLDQGLEPSMEADRRTLLRRLHFDLVGLPPTPEDVQRFMHDPSPQAYELEVERLLASPRYGERWARHWLDVVHYADTHGYDKDKPRRHAWPYRDWVIDALNGDMPWGQFVREQIAGDVLPGASPSAVAATGMLAAGPWDFVGHVELREGTVDKQKTRNLDRDDVVKNVFSSFQSLTVHCARCHDHKFDPISQADYYNAQAVFAGVERADREYDADPEVGARRTSLAEERAALQAAADKAHRELARRLAEDPSPELRKLGQDRDGLRQAVEAPDRTGSMGYHSALEASADHEKWVRVDLGAPRPIDRVTVFPCDEVFGDHDGAGFGLPAAFTVRLGTGDTWAPLGTWRAADEPHRHGSRPITLTPDGRPLARFVEVQVPRLWKRTDQHCFALAELEVWSGGDNVALGAEVTASDTIEAGARWGRRMLVDGAFPWTAAMARLDEAERRWRAATDRLEGPQARRLRAERLERVEAMDVALAALPARRRVYAATSNFAPQGAFTPPPGGRPRAIHRLERGEVTQPAEPSVPGGLAVLSHAPASFAGALAAEEEGARRVALARWIAHPENPLTWRSAVNRVWHLHFGRGLVGTPNDFGRMGERPTHPELLDFLAARFRDSGGSLKDLHRQLVHSATYRQASTHRPEAAAVDRDNRLLWRAHRRRLEAEALRDAALSVSGQLDLTAGGPGFELFRFEDDHSPRYLYAEVDPDAPGTHRRSVYRFIVRSAPDPWMAAFDCADPSNSTPVRSDTTTPLQALSLLNDRFMLAQAGHFAGRVEAELAGMDPVERAAWLAWQRRPSQDELRLLEGHAEAHGLPALCRVLLNSNEFLYVD